MAFTTYVSSQTVHGESIQSGTQALGNGGVANFTTINRSGFQGVWDCGVANYTAINSGGTQGVEEWGVANYTGINSGGFQGVGLNGTANNTDINGNGARQEVSSGGIANLTTINCGKQWIGSGGLANSTAINSNSYQDLFGVANYTAINSGGIQIVESGGTATSSTINSGGSQIVSSGGNIVGTLIIAGGHAAMANASAVTTLATIRYELANAQANDILLTVNSGSLGSSNTTYSLDLNNTSSGSYILAVGTDLYSLSGKSFSVIYIGQNINLQVGSSYTFTDGNSLSLNFTDSATDQLTAIFSDIVPPSAPATLMRTVTKWSVALDWDDATDDSGVKRYEFQIDNNNDFSSNEKAGTALVSNANATGLADGTYYWRVRALDNSGNYSTWSSGSSFTVDVTPPSVPTTLIRTVTGNGVTLDWADATDNLSGVKQYQIMLDNNYNFSSPEYSASPITNTASASNLADGTYFWRVRTQDNAGNYSIWASGSNFMVDITAPTNPAILTSTISWNNAVLDWADATDATSGVKQYEYQVDNNADFSSNEKSGIANVSNVSVSGIADGNYYWRIRTQDNLGNYSAWTTGSNFMVDISAPAPATLTGTVTGNNVTLDWADATDTTSGVKQYQVQLDKHIDFSTPEYSATPTASTANFSGLADGTFYWRVRTKDCAGNYSTWTSGSNFMIDITAPTNPATLTSTISWNNAVLDWADATDATSRVKQYEVQLDRSIDFSSPEYSESPVVSNINVTGLADGIYYWRVRTQDNVGNYSGWSNGSSFVSDAASGNISSALLLSSPSTTGWVGTGDVADYYKITMTNAGMLTLSLTGLTGNADMTLLDSKGTMLKSSAKTGTADEAIAGVPLQAGTYYVKVAPGFGVKDASYTLTHAEKYCPTDIAANTWQTARNIDDGVDNWVGFGDSADFYKLTMTNAGMLSIGLTGLTGNADLTLLNLSGMQLKASSSTGTTSEAINNVALLAGTYYVKVTAGYGVNDANYTLAHTEKYTPADKAANDYKTALDISNLDNWVGFGDAADFYKLTMTNAGTLTLGLTGLTGNADLSLLNSAGTAIKTSANTGTTPESINNVLLLAGTYYVKVAAGTGVNDAAYTLTHTEKYTPVDKAANDYKTALDISTLDNWVGFGDAADFYKLTMTNAGMLTLGLTGLTGNADLALLNSAGTAIKTSSNTGITSEAITNVALLAGTYYVKVATGFGVNDASYTLAHTEKYCPADAAANTWQTAQDISNLDNWVGFGDAADFYKLTMINAGALTLGLTWLTGNADLSLLNSAGTAIKTSANTGTNPEAINNVLLLAGTYYVKVAAGFGVNDASYTLSHLEKYTPVDTGANTWQTAKNIDDGVDNWVGFGDTADFYKLTMTNAGMLTLGLTGLTGNADLTLLNAGGMQLKTSSNTGITSEAITNVALLAGTYYVKVATGYGVNDAGYTLTHTEKYTPADTGANTWQTAKQIDDGVDNWVGFGDAADFYKLTMTNAGMLSLGLTGLTGNADLTLLNASGMQLKASSSTGTTSEAINNVALLAGTYYVKVAIGFGVNDASYTLAHTEKYCPADKAANVYKTALDISNLDNWVGFGDSADFYKLTMTNAGTLTLGLTGLTGNADLALLNSAGTALKTSAKAGTANEAITGVSLLAGTYYVKVATGFGVNDASYNLSNTVSYFPGDTSDKAGNTLAAAKLVDSPAQTGWVGFGDADDYYKFDIAAAAQGTLRLYDMTGGNADLTLYDAKGAQLQKSAKTGALEDTITRNLAAGTYYARVNAVSGNIDYKLDFSKKDGYGMLAS